MFITLIKLNWEGYQIHYIRQKYFQNTKAEIKWMQ